MPVGTDPGGPGSGPGTGTDQHDDKPYDYGPPDLKPDLLQFYSFRFKAFTGPGQKKETLLTNVEAATWDDGGGDRGAILTGTLTVRDPAFGVGTRVRLDVGDIVRCEWSGGAGWQEAWEMRVSEPGLAVPLWQRTYQLANDLDLLARSLDDFLFRAGPGTAQPDGWTFDEVIGHVCKRYGIEVECVKGTFRRQKTWAWRNVSPLEVFQKAMNTERLHTSKRFQVKWTRLRSGKHGIRITTLRRNPDLLALGSSLIEAAYSAHLARGEATFGVNEGYFASSLTVKARADIFTGVDVQGHNKTTSDKMEIFITPQNSAVAKKARDRFGFVHRIVWSADAKTLADLEREGGEYMAAVAKPVKSLTLTHVGIPTIRRGDAIQLGLGDAALLKQIVWVTDVQFSLLPADFTMTITVTFDDPYIDKLQHLFPTEGQATTTKPVKARGRSDTVSGIGQGGGTG